VNTIIRERGSVERMGEEGKREEEGVKTYPSGDGFIGFCFAAHKGGRAERGRVPGLRHNTTALPWVEFRFRFAPMRLGLHCPRLSSIKVRFRSSPYRLTLKAVRRDDGPH